MEDLLKHVNENGDSDVPTIMVMVIILFTVYLVNLFEEKKW